MVQTSDPHTLNSTKVGLYERRTYKRQTGTNVGLVQTSDWYKRRTGTNVRLVQTSDGYKRQTGTNVGLIQTSAPVQMSTGTFIRKHIGLWLSLKKR